MAKGKKGPPNVKIEELKLKKYNAETERLKVWSSLGRGILGIVVLGWWLNGFTTSFIQILTYDADKISMLSKLVDSFGVSQVVWAIVALGLGTIAWKERKGKQRAIKEKAKYQSIVEAGDPMRTTSGLTDIGANS